MILIILILDNLHWTKLKKLIKLKLINLQEGVQEIKHISDLSPEEQAQFNHQLKILNLKFIT